MSRAYLLGALHDSTEREYTYRLSQNSKDYVELVASTVRWLGYNAWTYREGQTREMYVVEFSKQTIDGCEVVNEHDKRDYVRGYFDADGSVPKDPDARLYIYFAQQDKEDLTEVKGFLSDLGIKTGNLHRPSKTAASDYWRFYVLTESHEPFANEIGSWHPRKTKVLWEKRRSTP